MFIKSHRIEDFIVSGEFWCERHNLKEKHSYICNFIYLEISEEAYE